MPKEENPVKVENEVVYADTNIEIYTLGKDEEVYGYKELRKVDEYNNEILVLQTLGYVESGSIYLGDEFTYISAAKSSRKMTVEEYEKLVARFDKVEEESYSALEKVKKLRTI